MPTLPARRKRNGRGSGFPLGSIPWVVTFAVLGGGRLAASLSTPSEQSRRSMLEGAAVAGAALVGSPITSLAAESTDTAVDMAAINAARATTSDQSLLGQLFQPPKEETANSSGSLAAKVSGKEPIDMEKINAARANNPNNQSSLLGNSKKTTRGIVPNPDPVSTWTIRGGPGGKSSIKIPRVGYSFYKTKPDQATRCTALALRAGIRHLDLGTAYESNLDISKALREYLSNGSLDAMTALREETPVVLERLDEARQAGEDHSKLVGGTIGSVLSPAPLGSAGRKGRRDGLFLSHKISNGEQSVDPAAVRRSVKAAIADLGCSYLDMVSIHSPLTDKTRRLGSYKALLDLRDSGFIKSVGVCNYGVGPLGEILDAGLDLPSLNQLELSPFNAHKDVVEWCDKRGISVACSAWSRLSSSDGPTEGWDILAKMAQAKGMTKAQILVRWALQKGYVCVPRSAASSKIERIAIAENSYGGVNTKASFMLTSEEMQILDGLDVQFKAGKLGRRDGWADADVIGPEWEPTDPV